MKNSLLWLRWVGALEGLSLLLLLGIAMPVKYMMGHPELVEVIGLAHGILFVFYCVLVAMNAYFFRWSILRTGLSIFLSIIPTGTFWLEPRWKRESLALRSRSNLGEGSL